MDDKRIIDGFRSYDADITKEYFYGYCRRAYNIYDHKYQLHNKTGLDFYSLAHEYYISLLKHEFKPLLDKPKGMKLSYWMTRGFHFVILDALKAYNREFEHQKEEVEDVVLNYVRSTDKEDDMLALVADAVANHYSDRMMQEIAHMVIYAGFKQKEVAEQLGITPSAVNQRYKKMMEEVVTPFVIENYGQGIYTGCLDISPFPPAERCDLVFEIPNMSKRSQLEKNVTPPHVTALKPNEVFVFGSNLLGIHAGGAARTARLYFGAETGVGVGRQGQSYAIPTMQGGIDTIKPYVDEFIEYAKGHPDLHFLVTPIGCGLAGFECEDIAPLFLPAKDLANISLPQEFRNTYR